MYDDCEMASLPMTDGDAITLGIWQAGVIKETVEEEPAEEQDPAAEAAEVEKVLDELNVRRG